MPGIIMHNHFAKIVYGSLSDELKDVINNQNLYEFAANAPDVFLYRGLYSKKNRTYNHELFDMMHTKNIKTFLISLANQCKMNKDLYAYLCGYLTHYYLDVFTNAYIIHKSGIYDPTINNSIRYRGLKQRMERAMDAYIVENYFNANPDTFNLNHKINKLKKLPKSIFNDLDLVYEQAYDLSNAHKLINKSIACERRFFFWIHDPIGIKNKIFSKIDNGKTVFDLNYLSYYNKTINSRRFDIFNFKHERWFNPADDTITSIDSFFDLMEKAKKISIEAISALYKYVYLDEEIDLNKYFVDVSMISGLPTNIPCEFKYFNCVFK